MGNRVCFMTKEELSSYLSKGMSSLQIAFEKGIGYKTVLYWIKQYSLQTNFPKLPPLHLDKIETKEWAYFIGFVCGDGSITETEVVELTLALKDKEILDFFVKHLFSGSKVRIDLTEIPEQRRKPQARLIRKIVGIKKFYGGRLKEDRNLPIVSPHLVRYLVMGFFDADGCITWGRRKDRNRVWQKVMFKSCGHSAMVSLQKILLKLKISTRMSVTQGAYVLEFCDKHEVLKFLDWLYADKSFIVLKRKFEKYKALRLELGENEEGANLGNLQ